MRLLSKTSPIPTILCVPLALLAIAALRAVILIPAEQAELDYLLTFTDEGQAIGQLLEGGPGTLLLAETDVIRGFSSVVAACGGFWILTAVAGMLVRRRWALRLIRTGYAAVLVAAALFCYVAARAAGGITGLAAEAGLRIDDLSLQTFLLQWSYDRWALVICGLAGGMLLLSWRGETRALYGSPEGSAPAAGDVAAEGLRTGGRDPAYRRSWLSSAMVHWLLIIVLPFLMLFRGCVELYRVPFGRGRPAITQVMRVVRKKKKRKKYLLRRNAAVFWDIPDLDESKIAEEVDEQTQLTHQADRQGLQGKMGAGDGETGGWPDGVPGGKIRFIRLEYRGRDWDDGMDAASGADINFLNFLRKEVPFPVARKSESHAIGLLARYPKGYAPSFVYVTGADNISASTSERRILREYLLNGGMLLADCGSARWDHSFRSFLRSVFPDKRLIDIADDDELYQAPYVFANGAPPLWHHGGYRAMGVKHKGRWIVFYHPGDINDAWKTGRSGMDPEMADKAFQMGVNVMYYAITRYVEMTRKYRKR